MHAHATRRLRPLALSMLVVTLGLASPSLAEVCVEIDTSRDMLEEQERRAARAFLESVLQDKGVEISDSNCTGVYRVHHLFFGQSITVVLHGPEGMRQSTVATLEEVPALYSQMVNALLDDKKMANSNGTVNRRNVTTNLSEIRRVDAEKVWFIRLGYGGIGQDRFSAGPALGMGFRYELDTIGVEISFLELVSGQGDGKYDYENDAAWSWVKLMALRYADPIGDASPYLGAGMSWGSNDLYTKDGHYNGHGLQADLRVGYEMLRSSNLRMFVQLDAGLPLYRSYRNDNNYHDEWSGDPRPADTGGDDLWAPTIAVSLGVGWRVGEH